MVWERSLEGWDAGTSRPVFSLYTRLLYDNVKASNMGSDGADQHQQPLRPASRLYTTRSDLVPAS